jgi:hypothetical protein
MTQLTKDDFEKYLDNKYRIRWVSYNGSHRVRHLYMAYSDDHFYAFVEETQTVQLIPPSTLILAILDHYIYVSVGDGEKDWKVLFGLQVGKEADGQFCERFKRDYCLPIPAKTDDANQGSGNAET